MEKALKGPLMTHHNLNPEYKKLKLSKTSRKTGLSKAKP